MKTALITGITGQDGSFLAEYLLSLDYSVIGIVRRSSTPNTANINHLIGKVKLVYGDLIDQGFIDSLFKDNSIDEVYNLAAQSFMPVSWNSPTYTAEINALGPLRLLEAIRHYSNNTRFYQASTSEMFGKVQETPQNERTPFYPRSPYGVAKLYGHWITVNYKESFNLFATSGILFNHESERRSLEFVTRKITNTAAKIKYGLESELRLGRLDVRRDWGYAGDYVKYMWKMLQKDEPDVYVLGTGENHSVKEFCEYAFGYFGLNYQDYVVIDPSFYRPAEVEILLADPTKAKKELDFKIDTSFENLVYIMCENDEREIVNGM